MPGSDTETELAMEEIVTKAAELASEVETLAHGGKLGFSISPALHNTLNSGNRLLYEQAYWELCELVTGKKPLKEPPPEPEFQEKVLVFLNENREQLHQKICVEFDYCGKRRAWGNTQKFLQGLIMLIGILAETMSCGAASAAWLMSSSLLDQFCECHKK